MKQRLDTYDNMPTNGCTISASTDGISATNTVPYGCFWTPKMENKSMGKEEKLEPISKELL